MRKWFFGAVLLLIIGAVFQLGLLMYAMYVFLGILLVSRYLTRSWTENLIVTRDVSTDTIEIGDKIAVLINLHNKGATRVTWVIAEDSVPRHALISKPPRIKITGKRTHLLSIKGEAGRVSGIRSHSTLTAITRSGRCSSSLEICSDCIVATGLPPSLCTSPSTRK